MKMTAIEILPRRAREAQVVLMPLVLKLSLIAMGIPSSTPSDVPK